jgi:hypothetical protein
MTRHLHVRDRFPRFIFFARKRLTTALVFVVCAFGMIFGMNGASAARQSTVPVASVVIGSFSQLAGAEVVLQQHQDLALMPLEIRVASVGGTVYYRVMSEASPDLGEVQATLSRIKSEVAGAWILREEKTVYTESASESMRSADSRVDAIRRSANEQPLLTGLRVADARTPGPRVRSATRSAPAVQRVAQSRAAAAQSLQSEAPVFTIATLDPARRVQLARAQTSAEPARSLMQAPAGAEMTVKLGGDEPVTILRFADTDIRIDGEMNEAVWGQVPGFDQFVVVEPDTLGEPRFRTIAKIFYSDEGLYVGMINHQPADTLLPRLTSRDKYINRDGVLLTLDTSGEGLYGLWFGVNLGGTLIDGTVLPERNYSSQWDGPWRGDSHVTEDGYTTEMFLPWSMMSMPDRPAERLMGVYFSRKIAYIDERWGYPALPMTGARLMSALQPIAMAGVEPRQQVAVFPFTAASYDNLATAGDEADYRVGVDLFWRPSTDLQVTATLNPDFGAVETDDVVVNLTAFETFFREKRLFFLEGQEIFETTPRSNPFSRSIGGNSIGARRTQRSFSSSAVTLVNTRRIGGAAIDPNIPANVTVAGVELSKPTEIAGAVKLTGQKGGLRYGFLGASEEDTDFAATNTAGEALSLQQTGRDFGVARLLYENAKRGRKAIGWMMTAVEHDWRDAYVQGIDMHYQSENRRLSLDSQLMYSDTGVEGAGAFFDLNYIPKRGVGHQLTFDYLDEELDVTDFGFIRRNDAIGATYNFSVVKSDLDRLKSLSNSILMSQQYNVEGKVVRTGIFLRTGMNFFNNSAINTQFSYFPKRWDDRNSQGNGDFRIHDRWFAEASYGSDSSKMLSASFGLGAEQEHYSGWTYAAKGGITWKPNDRFSFDLDINYKDRDGWLLWQGDRNFTTFEGADWQPQLAMDVFLSARHQFRMTMQWVGLRMDEQAHYEVPMAGSGQGYLLPVLARDPALGKDDFAISRITAQLRYRWEIAPLSDLFLVYTRGSNLAGRVDDEFGDLFQDALSDPIVDVFVIKLRYRFGN